MQALRIFSLFSPRPTGVRLSPPTRLQQRQHIMFPTNTTPVIKNGPRETVYIVTDKDTSKNVSTLGNELASEGLCLVQIDASEIKDGNYLTGNGRPLIICLSPQAKKEFMAHDSSQESEESGILVVTEDSSETSIRSAIEAFPPHEAEPNGPRPGY